MQYNWYQYWMGVRDPQAYQVALVLKNPLANARDIRDGPGKPLWSYI